MMNLRHKILLAFLFFVIIPFVTLGMGTFVISQQLIEKKYSEQTRFTLHSMARNIDNLIKEADNFSDSWLIKDQVQNFLRHSLNPDYQPDQLAGIQLEKKLEQSLILFSPLESVTMYGNNGQWIRIGQSRTVRTSYRSLQSSPLYGRIMKRNSLPLWVPPDEIPMLHTGGNAYTQLRVVKDLNTFDNIGVVMMTFNFDELNDIFNSYYDDGGRLSNQRYFLADRNGRIVFDSKGELDGRRLQSYMARKINFQLGYQSFKGKFDTRESIVSVYNLQYGGAFDPGLSIVAVTPWRYLTGEMIVIVKWLVGIAVVCLVLLIFFNLFFVERLTGTILMIVRAMRHVQSGDFRSSVKVRGKDEAALLANGFNTMAGRIAHLLEEVKQEQERKQQAEMQLLQAQIRPHFLFNALESMNALAIQNKGKMVSKMIYRLGNILRFTLQGADELTLKEEVEHVVSYLEIQKFRFSELFDYEVNLPGHLEKQKILKFTLQPLVENCILHGFDGIAYPGRIKIEFSETAAAIKFAITDNGRGISNDDLQKLQSEEPGGNHGLGIRNVNDRLNIHYGASCGLIICSREGQGTIIQGTVPRSGRRGTTWE